MSELQPLLTIAIPTYNRSGYLAASLAQLSAQLQRVPPGTVEVIVSDNCSPDATPQVVEQATASHMPIRYIRNTSNLGWALNFIQCFDIARGRYILMSGDDDLLVDGALALLLDRLGTKEYGVICVRPYGFDSNFRAEKPADNATERTFHDAESFLLATHRWFTLTSALVINKSLLAGANSREFLDTDLATFHLMLRATLAAKQNLFIDRYLIASKRQNSFSYEYADVFVDQFWRILDAQVRHGLSPRTLRALEQRRLFAYYPFYLFDLRTSGRGDLNATYDKLARRFKGRYLFEYWLAPTLRLPRALAVAWGGMTTAVGRAASGDLRRGLTFARSRVLRFLSPRQSPA